MNFADQVKREFEKIASKKNDAIERNVIALQGELIESSPVDTGELKRSWQEPVREDNKWTISNIAPHAVTIDQGRRTAFIYGTRTAIGSEQLPDGYTPIVKNRERKLQKDLDAIRN